LETTTNGSRLPTTQGIRMAYVLSLIIAVLMAAASIAGILYPADIYPAEELLAAFVPNDVVNLAIGVPILLGAMWLAGRGRLIGLLFWPGALFYALYNYAAYLFAMPLTWMYLVCLALVALTLYTMVGLVASIDGKAIQQRLMGAVPERVAGGVLVVFGAFFLFRAVDVMAAALINQTVITAVERAANTADFLISPALIVGGVLLWRRQAFGYAVGAGLLFHTSMLFVGLVIFMLIQPLLTDVPFPLVDTIVVFIMGLVFSIPLVLFIRGIASTRRP
jgi:hypothetical protein